MRVVIDEDIPRELTPLFTPADHITTSRTWGSRASPTATLPLARRVDGSLRAVRPLTCVDPPPTLVRSVCRSVAVRVEVVELRSGILVAGACLVAGAVLVGCGTGAVSPDVQAGRADVNDDGSGGSIETADWTYSLPTTGIPWVDRQGDLHDGGRPECLAPGTSTDVRFASVEVHVGPETWRAVVWISCQ